MQQRDRRPRLPGRLIRVIELALQMAPVNQLEFSPCCYVAPKSPPLILPYSCQCLALPAPRVPLSARTPAYTCQRRPVHEPRTMPRTRQSALSIPATSAWALGSPRGAVIIAQAVRWLLVLPRAKVRSPTACVSGEGESGGGGLARSGGGGLPGTEQRRQQQAATAAHPPMRKSSGRGSISNNHSKGADGDCPGPQAPASGPIRSSHWRGLAASGSALLRPLCSLRCLRSPVHGWRLLCHPGGPLLL